MPHNVTLIPGAGVALPRWYDDTIGDLSTGAGRAAAERGTAVLREVIAGGRHATYELGADAGNRGLADAIIARLG